MSDIRMNQLLNKISDFDSLILNQDELIKLVNETVDPYLAELIEGTLLIMSSEEIPNEIKKLKKYLRSQSNKGDKTKGLVDIINKIDSLDTFSIYEDKIMDLVHEIINPQFADLLSEVYGVMSDDEEVVDEMRRLKKTLEGY